MAALGEIRGGLLLAVGFATPAADCCRGQRDAGAVMTVLLAKGFFAQNGGYEYPFLLAVAAVTFAFTGPGSLSIDAVVGLERSGAFWGIAALLAGLFGGPKALLEWHKAPVDQNRYQVNLED